MLITSSIVSPRYMMLPRYMSAVSVVLLSSVALFWSSLAISKSQEINSNNTSTKMVASAKDAITDKQLDSYFSQMSPLDKAKASSWGLSDKEWARYKKLKETSFRGVLTPDIDPITLLGVESKTDSERIRYAKMFNDLEIKRSIADIAFAHAQNKDIERRIPNSNAFKSSAEKKAIRKSNYINQIKEIENNYQSEYVAYIDLEKDCEAYCKSKLFKITSNSVVHFYFLNAKEDKDIYQFLAKMEISQEKIKSGEFTLNVSEVHIAPFKDAIKIVPVELLANKKK